MKLDAVLTVAVGRNDRTGREMNAGEWARFQAAVRAHCDRAGLTVAHADGAGIGSDDLNEGKPEDTAVFIVINPTDVEGLRREIARVLIAGNASSACFALDRTHEPVFATVDGTRPAARADYQPVA